MALGIKTSVKINASKEEIWEVLTHFSNYSNWNPFITSISGEPVVGKNLTATIDGMTFKPEVLVSKPYEELKWKGKLLFTGIFDGEHQFKITNNKDGTCTFSNNEKFTGFLPFFMKSKLKKDVTANFIAMNRALKKEAEN